MVQVIKIYAGELFHEDHPHASVPKLNSIKHEPGRWASGCYQYMRFDIVSFDKLDDGVVAVFGKVSNAGLIFGSLSNRPLCVNWTVFLLCAERRWEREA
jgi:hypothetical protein